jgi:GPH family glycoside/pentoside/hexuronide:cation symporter
MSQTSFTSSDAPKPLKTSEKVCYGLGDVAFGLAVSSVGFWLLIYLTDVAGLGAFLAGISIMIGRAWDAITDPVMGWITDHTKSRWGKRRPYLLFGAIPYALSFFSLWVIPGFESQMHTFLYITIALIVFNTALTVVFVPYTSLTAAITNDYNERTSLTGFRMFCSQSAFLLGAAIPSFLAIWVISTKGAEILTNLGIQEFFGSWAQTPRQGYFIMAAIFAVIMVGAIWTTFLGCHEKDSCEDETARNDSKSPFSYIITIFQQMITNQPFRLSVMIMLLTSCAATLIAVNLPYFIQYSLEMTEHRTRIISLLFIVAVATVPFWVKITKRYGKAESYRVAMVVYSIVLCCLPFVKMGGPVLAYIASIAAGFCHAAALMIPWAIIPDVVEYDELKVGMRREGLFYGGTTFSYKLATAFAVFLSGSLLAWIGYVPNEDQSRYVINGINMLVGPVPASILLLGSYLSLRYPLTSAKHKEILLELAKKKAEASQS